MTIDFHYECERLGSFRKQKQFYLFNEAVSEDAEVEHLSQSVDQVTDHRSRIWIDSINLDQKKSWVEKSRWGEEKKELYLGSLISKQSQHDGGGQHVEQQGDPVGITNSGHQPTKETN